jgi:F0F1-type ATP synthase delta subunit
MRNSIAQDLFNTLQTKQRVNEFIRLFDYVEGLSHHIGSFNVEVVLHSIYGDSKPDWVSSFVKNIPGLMSGKISEEDINLLRAVREIVEKSTTAKIEINFVPSAEFISDVVKILRENYDGMNFIIDVNTVENLESGAMFYIDGNVIDLTVRKRVINYLTTQDVINRYL